MAELVKEMTLAGATAVIVVNFTHPIETVKTNMQVNSNFSVMQFVRSEGAGGLYKGIQPAWLREATYTSFKLGLYGPIKKLFGADQKDSPFALKFAAGSVSGVLGSFVGNPFDLLKTVQQSATKSNSQTTAQLFHGIYQERGIQGFYRGIQANAARACVLNGTKMGVYDYSKGITHDLTGWERKELRTQFLSATVTGFAMTCTVSPFDRIRTLLMNQGKVQQYSGFMDCAMQTVKSEGVLSLWRGFFPIWARFAPQATGQLLVFELLRSMAGMKTM